MRKFWIALLAAALFLSACGQKEDEPQSSIVAEESTEQESVVEDSQESVEESVESQSSWMDERRAVSAEGNLYEIALKGVEIEPYTTLYEVGEHLMLTSVEYETEDGNVMTIKSVDQKTGELLAEKSFTTKSFVGIQVSEDLLCLYDSSEGWIQVYDTALVLQKEYSYGGDSSSWLIANDFKTLYVADWETGLKRVDLETGSEELLVDNVNQLSMNPVNERYALLMYTDLDTLLSTRTVVDLAANELMEPPIKGEYYGFMQAGDMWCTPALDVWTDYLIYKDGQLKKVSYPEGQLSLLQGGHILCANENQMTVYDMNGGFVCHDTLPTDGGAYMVGMPCYSHVYNGYFVVTGYSDNSFRLLFWDMNTPGVGAPLVMETLEEETVEGSLVSQHLYDRAQALSEQYDLDIRIAEQCTCNSGNYTMDMLTDETTIEAALDMLEEALGSFPNGFFTQLKSGTLKEIRIEVWHNLQKLSSSEEDEFHSFSAFVHEAGDHRLMVLDADKIIIDTIYHEFSHMIDDRLAFDASMREGALFSEEKWLELQPEGFEFPGTMSELPDYAWEAANNGHFIKLYGATFPTEDRATIFESAMMRYDLVFDEYETLRSKLAYYSECIRDSFDTTGWPEVTRWEEPLY